MTYEETARHEAAHAAMASLVGAEVEQISTLPQGFRLGHVSLRPGDPARQAVVLLAPLIEAGAVPTWPIHYPRTGDEHDLRKLIEDYDLSEREWHALVAAAPRLSASREYERLMVATAQVLNQTRVVGRELFGEVEAIAERNARYG